MARRRAAAKILIGVNDQQVQAKALSEGLVLALAERSCTEIERQHIGLSVEVGFSVAACSATFEFLNFASELAS